ncbi:MAG: bifunctional 4-hydroxy-2-oxoglutarate aldolase/2-dehydro-3-deoxy-phosphogluconate aldolase [Caulobacter sp.]|nr:bifunctional 4-hydroxy-2-oxoglutarate aldolase/2-dehydro-3-deoxy-phosphogluconate aldolase [Caulobacter sp.]
MIDLLRRAVVVPVLTIDSAEQAVPLARALALGGLTVLEVTLRTDAALEAMTRIVGEVEGVVVAAGTVLSRRDLDRAAKAGAAFAVSPGLTRDLVEPHPLPLTPGVATASEIMTGLEAGLTAFKFFPAIPAGGAAVLQAWSSPFPQARFCPTGGVHAGNAASLLALPNVLCVGGAWVAPKGLIDACAWDEITRLATAAAALADSAQP